MRRLGGDRSLFRQVVAFYFDDAPKLMSDLHQAITSADAEAARRAAHSLKGLAATIGAQACADGAVAVESASAEGSIEAIVAQVPLLEEELAKVDQALRCDEV